MIIKLYHVKCLQLLKIQNVWKFYSVEKLKKMIQNSGRMQTKGTGDVQYYWKSFSFSILALQNPIEIFQYEINIWGIVQTGPKHHTENYKFLAWLLHVQLFRNLFFSLVNFIVTIWFSVLLQLYTVPVATVSLSYFRPTIPS